MSILTKISSDLLDSLIYFKYFVMCHCRVFFDELGVNHVVAEYARLGFLNGQAHFGRHSVLVALDDQVISSVQKESLCEDLTQFGPRLLVQKDVEALHENNLLLLAVEVDLVLLWVLLGVVEVREATRAILETSRDVLHKFGRVECEFGSSSGICVNRIFHLVQLVTVIVVAVHGQHERLNLVLFFQDALDFLAEVALTGGTGAGNSNEWNRT